MAKFIPVGQTGNYHGSPAERQVYEAFKQLPDDYIVFYSVKWGRETKYGYYQKGEADFLLFDPTRGFLVIEVKGGGIKRDADGQWFSIDHDGAEYKLNYSPLDQAWRSVNKFVDLLKTSVDETIRNYKILPTVWFPQMKGLDIQSNLPSEYQPANTFADVDIDMPEAAINRAFYRNGITEKLFEKAPKQLIDEVIKIFAPTFRIVPSLSADIKEKDFLFNQLTIEQATLLDYLGEQRVAGIQGASGTGKTMIALEAARRLPTEDRILFLGFNRLLIDFLNENYAEKMPNVTFTSINRLYAKTSGTEIAEEDELTDFLLNTLDTQYHFDHIIIDEGQDFKANHLDLLLTSIRAKNGYFYVFYDKNQLVHQWDESTIEWLNKLDCRLVLHKNCRNTFEIAKAAYSSVGIENVILAADINGDVPCLNNYESTERAIEGIAETIRFYTTEKGFKREQITILTLKTLEKSILAGKESIGGYRLTNERNGDGILFSTARKFKGLESDVIIITDIDGDTFKDNNAKCAFYVASSRAKFCLTYIAALSEEDMRKIIVDLGGEAGNNPEKTLSDMLNIKIQQIA